ncbi:MAG: hypothetical protein PHR79_07330 [Bacteroidales bacterium]|nr:hypothetical protein [Bacteroidales bacterium]
MQVNNEKIKEFGQEITWRFSNVSKVGAKSISEYEINCDDLEEKYLKEDIRHSVKYKDLFDKLQKIEHSPCVYYFEILSDITPDIVVDKINSTDRNTPAIKGNYPKNSNILYVGKVKSLFWGRLIMHLGYHTQKNGNLSYSHGLQIYHWAKELSLKLKVYVFEFEPEMADLMSALEFLFAKELNPIIGKHG